MIMTPESNKDQTGILTDPEMVKGIENSLFSVAHVNGIMLETMLNYNKEIFDFFQHRLSEDMKTAHKFASCKNLTDLGEECTEFCGRALEEYPAEIAKLTNMGFGLATQALGRLQEEAVATKTNENASVSPIQRPVKKKNNGNAETKNVA